MNALAGIVLLAAIVACAFTIYRRRAAHPSVRALFSQFIFSKTVDALVKEGENGPINKDGLWAKEHLEELFDKYGESWIAVVEQRVIANAQTGEEAWAHAIKVSPRSPFVRRLYPGLRVQHE